MKIKSIFVVIALSFGALAVKAQTEIPTGYTKATIILANGTTASGYIKDNIKKSASIVYLDNTGANKKTYDGSELNSLNTATENFICIKGDFFKTICTGKIYFLQKASNAANKISYNGTEAIINSGTEGKIGDYFVYSGNTLKLINKKTVNAFITTDLSGCAEAIEKASTINGNIAKLQEAVEVYNKNNK